MIRVTMQTTLQMSSIRALYTKQHQQRQSTHIKHVPFLALEGSIDGLLPIGHSLSQRQVH